ncbi:MAG TPA: DUF1566 domain-containing protein [Candidatus Binatia bacterium]
MQRFISSVRVTRVVVLITPLLIAFTAGKTAALSTGFTYQGQLVESGVPSSGPCDFQFSLWDAAGSGTPPTGGTRLGDIQSISGVDVTNGLFTVVLNNSAQFGATAFSGPDRYLQIAVSCGGSPVTLSPRQPLTATPYALYAPTAGSANGLSCSGCVTAGALGPGAVQQSNLAFTPGTVTSITAGTGLSGGTITTSGTLSNSGVLSVGASTPLASSGGQNPSLSLTGTVPVANGGTGASTAATARTSLGAAANGANSDITQLNGIQSPNNNTWFGQSAFTVAGGTGNTALGYKALTTNSSGFSNTAVGDRALQKMTLGSNNTAVGLLALPDATQAAGNLALGSGAGTGLTTGNYNIYVAASPASGTETGTIRIGSSPWQTKAFMAGVSGAGLSGGAPVVVNAAGQIGTVTGGSTRFTDNGQTVTDHTTGLMWEKKTGTNVAPVNCSMTTCSSPQDVNNQYQWCQDANHNGTCDNNGPYANNPPDGGAFFDFLARTNGVLCSSETCTGLGGHTDWRLPTIAELKTILLSPYPCSTSPCIDQTVFGPTQSYIYWSATTVAGTPDGAWGVFFHDGYVNYGGKPSGYYVRAVRSGS